ncbi:hypothetical protein MBLNU230_g6541t1 [Neophaeotheca triangularis]
MQPHIPAGVTELDVACAISIVNSKPPEISIQDWLEHIQQHVARGRRDRAASSIYRHLDRSSFWRAEASRAQVEAQEARHEAFQLKLEVEALKAKVEAVKTDNATSKKRKKVDEDVVPVPRSPKKAKRDVSPARRVPNVQSAGDFERDFEFAASGKDGELLMRSLYHINRTLKVSERTDPVALTYHLANAASVLPKIVQKAVGTALDTLISRTDDLRDVLAASARSVAVMIVGLGRLSRVVQGQPQFLGQVVYAYTGMFATLLEVFQEASESETRRAMEAEGNANSTVAGKAASKYKSKAKIPKPTNIRDNALLSMLSSFLAGIIDLLDPKIEAHRELFEGFAYCIFNMLGRHLYVLTFNHQRSPNPSSDIETASTLLKQTETDQIEPQPSKTLAHGTAKLEAPYLIYMLRTLIASAPAHLSPSPASSTSTTKGKRPSTKPRSKSSLAVAARERLQRTLITSMFGTEGLQEGSPLLECLSNPVAKGAATVPKVKDEGVGEWFIEEVWRSLGWEVLAREGGF